MPQKFTAAGKTFKLKEVRKPTNKIAQRKFSMIHAVNLVSLIQEHPYTAHQLAEKTGLHLRTVYDFCNVGKMKRLLHIIGWEPDALGRDCIPIFAWGYAVNATRTKLTPAERAKRYRDKNRKPQNSDIFNRNNYDETTKQKANQLAVLLGG